MKARCLHQSVTWLFYHPSTQISTPSSCRTMPNTTPLFLSSKDDNRSALCRQSSFEIMQRDPLATIIDNMITKLSYAKSYKIPYAVSQAKICVVSSPSFFLCIAETVSDPMEVSSNNWIWICISYQLNTQQTNKQTNKQMGWNGQNGCHMKKV